MHHYVGRRHGTRGRHVVLVVCRAWLQPPRTEPCRGKPVAEHVSCHVRRADTRTGHRTGQTAIGHSPSFHAKDFLCRQRFGGRGNRIENGRTIPICGRKAGKKQFRDHPFRLPRRHVERDVGMRPCSVPHSPYGTLSRLPNAGSTGNGTKRTSFRYARP